MSVDVLQRYASTLSQGFKDEYMGNSPGRWVDAVATYCKNRPRQLSPKTVTKHCDRVDEIALYTKFGELSYPCRRNESAVKSKDRQKFTKTNLGKNGEL